MLYSLHVAVGRALEAVHVSLLDRVEQAQLLLIILQSGIVESSLSGGTVLIASGRLIRRHLRYTRLWLVAHIADVLSELGSLPRAIRGRMHSVTASRLILKV